MKSMVRDVSEWCIRSLVCKVKEVDSDRRYTSFRNILLHVIVVNPHLLKHSTNLNLRFH